MLTLTKGGLQVQPGMQASRALRRLSHSALDPLQQCSSATHNSVQKFVGYRAPLRSAAEVASSDDFNFLTDTVCPAAHSTLPCPRLLNKSSNKCSLSILASGLLHCQRHVVNCPPDTLDFVGRQSQIISSVYSVLRVICPALARHSFARYLARAMNQPVSTARCYLSETEVPPHTLWEVSTDIPPVNTALQSCPAGFNLTATLRLCI